MRLLRVYKQLLGKFGKQNWWPLINKRSGKIEYSGRTPRTKNEQFEIVAGAILTQNASWKNAEKALLNLYTAKMLDAGKMARAPLQKLQSLIKPSGFYRQKAKRLREVAKHFILFNPNRPLSTLRAELLSMDGIGPETADSILLYAYNKPTFVIDAYTRRFCDHHKLTNAKKYDEYRQFFQKNLPRSVSVYREFHALIVEWGKGAAANLNRLKP